MLLLRVSICLIVATEILTFPTGAPEPLAQRKRLILQPRTKPAAEEQEGVVPAAESESSEEETVLEASSEMTEDEATRVIHYLQGIDDSGSLAVKAAAWLAARHQGAAPHPSREIKNGAI